MKVLRMGKDVTSVLLEFRTRRKNLPMNIVAKYLTRIVVSVEPRRGVDMNEGCFFWMWVDRRKLTQGGRDSAFSERRQYELN